jgi:hypothetical protein
LLYAKCRIRYCVKRPAAADYADDAVDRVPLATRATAPCSTGEDSDNRRHENEPREPDQYRSCLGK